VGGLLSVRGANREPIQEISRLRHRYIGLVGREHDAVNTNLEQQVEVRLGTIESTERVMEVLAEVGADRAI